MTTLLLSIDPGSVSGAFAVFYDNREPDVGDLPVVDGQVNAVSLAGLLRAYAPRAAVIERVSAMPKQGVSSTFKFGVGYGIAQGVVLGLGIPLRLVTPSEWKRGMGVGSDKEVCRALAIRTYPSVEGLHLKKHQGRAEALLLGRYVLKGGLR